MSELERRLAACLEPVRAPESLWYRVAAEIFPAPSPPPSLWRPGLVLAMAILICTAAWSVAHRPPTLAAAALRLHRENHPLGRCQLPGGRTAVFYRVDGHPVTLLIAPSARPESKQPKRIQARPEPAGRATIFTWEARGQAYALVSSLPDESRRACTVCHS